MTKIFTQVLPFFIKSFTLNEIWELEKIYLPTAAFKEDTNKFSTEFRQSFGAWLWLYNKALIDQLVRSIREIFGPQLFVRTSLRSVRTSKLLSEYFSVWYGAQDKIKGVEPGQGILKGAGGETA